MDNKEDIDLNTQWNVWYHHSMDDWTIKGYRKIFDIKTVNDFWKFFNNINCIGGINNLHFFLMRDGITPIYEDQKNRNGGVWSMLTQPNKSYELWENIAVKMIGETLINESMTITGLSINLKNGIPVIKIWNNDKSKNSVSFLPILPHLSSEIVYRHHKLEF